MSLALKIRDMFKPPNKILKEANIKLGDTILDFGCGPGSYSLAAARMVGEKGQVYSLDIHPMAIKSIKRRALRQRLKNIHAIISIGDTDFPDRCMDGILVYDVFHELDKPEENLAEMHRLLKDNGIVFVSDHHLKDQEILAGMTRENYFQLVKKGKKTYTFEKVKA